MANSEWSYRNRNSKNGLQIKKSTAPEYLNSMVVKLSEFRNRQLHDNDTDLYVPLLKTACGQKSYPIEEQSFGIASKLK